MNAKDFFEQYSIETINKKTRISPISLRFIKNREFEKIPRVKFLGFIRIIEKEFKVDLSELIDEYNTATNHIKKNLPEKEMELEEPKKNNTMILFILAVVLFSLGAYMLYRTYTSKHTPNNIKKTAYIPANEANTSSKETNQSEQTPVAEENNISKVENPVPKPLPKQQTADFEKKAVLPENIKIFPNEKVWFRAVNLDSNKTVQYLTSNPKILNGADWYIKFGHGNITISYGNQTITPKTKKIVRLLFKNGKVTYLKYPNRYEK